jgi:hypothetical protein
VSGGFKLVYLYDENGPILDEYGYPMQDVLYVTNIAYTFWPSNTTGIAHNYQQGVLVSTNSASPLAAPSTCSSLNRLVFIVLPFFSAELYSCHVHFSGVRSVFSATISPPPR